MNELTEAKVLGNVYAGLSDSKEILAEFLADYLKGKHIHWHIYKQEKGKVIGEHHKGRSVPYHKPRTKGTIEKTKLMGERLHIPMLYLLHLKTKKEKVAKILGSDIDKKLKAELILSA